MRAAVLSAPGGPEALTVQTVPDPRPRPGHVLIDVRAFGLNRSEMFTRQGHSPGVQLPRVLGIECVGTVRDAGGTGLSVGQTVAAMMGGMGREFDGGYAERCLVPRRCVFPLQTWLPWWKLGAIPEMVQTAAGSLNAALDCQAGETLLIRGGTSSVGMTAATLAKARGLEVLATTRNPAKVQKLRDNGVDHVIIDDGHIHSAVREVCPDGVHKVLELVGTVTLRDSLRCARPRGVVCMTGILGNSWALDAFQPMVDIPHTVRLTAYSGGPEDIAPSDLQAFVSAVEAGQTRLHIDRVFPLDDIVAAHTHMEANRASGKLVCVPDPADLPAAPVSR